MVVFSLFHSSPCQVFNLSYIYSTPISSRPSTVVCKWQTIFCLASLRVLINVVLHSVFHLIYGYLALLEDMYVFWCWCLMEKINILMLHRK